LGGRRRVISDWSRLRQLLSMSASNALTVELLRAAGIGELQKVIKWLRKRAADDARASPWA
jgi:hypothetical protein